METNLIQFATEYYGFNHLYFVSWWIGLFVIWILVAGSTFCTTKGIWWGAVSGGIGCCALMHLIFWASNYGDNSWDKREAIQFFTACQSDTAKITMTSSYVNVYDNFYEINGQTVVKEVADLKIEKFKILMEEARKRGYDVSLLNSIEVKYSL